MKKLIFCALLLGLFATDAEAAKGVVVYAPSQCHDYFVVETNLGFDLLEWFGGHLPNEGERIIGEFESYGMKDVYVLPNGQSMKVWVEDYWLTTDSAARKLREKCQ